MKQRDLFLIVIFTFITVLAWIIFTVYHAHITSTISPTLREKIEPIQPRFDTAVIDILRTERKKIETLPETPSASPGGGSP